MAARGKLTSSERAALGRPASLGQHYDIINDRLLDTSLPGDWLKTKGFVRNCPDMKTTSSTFSIEDSFSLRLDGLNIPLDQKLGLMFGVHEKLKNNYDELIKWKKKSHRIVTGTLIHTIYTTSEDLDTSRALEAARGSRNLNKATHIVSGITRGYQLILTFHRRVLSSFETEVVKTELKDFISEAKDNFTNPDALRDIFRKYRHFDLKTEVHGYVKQTYEDWDIFCDSFPEWLKGISAKKDRPIMIKVDKVDGFGHSFSAGYTEIGKDNFKEIEDHFQGINNAKCAFTDFYNDVRDNQESITRPELRDIQKIREQIESDLEKQTSRFRTTIEKNRSINSTVYMIFSQYLINESKIMKDLSKFENSVAAHAVIAEMKARGCGIIHPQSELQEKVDSSYEILVFHYYPKEKGLFKSSIWFKNYEFFINALKNSTQKYDFYLMEHESPGLVNRFVGRIWFSNPASAYVSHYYCGEEKSNNCAESPYCILLKNMAESLANPHQEAEHDTDVQTDDFQKKIENTASKQITHAQALGNDLTVTSVQEKYTPPLTESSYATNNEARDQVRSRTNLVNLQPDSQKTASSEAGNRKPIIVLSEAFGNAELTEDELRHNLKVFGGSLSRPSKAVHSVGCLVYDVRWSDDSDPSSGNNAQSCDDETSSISREEGQRLAMASSKDYHTFNRMQNQSTRYGCPNISSGLGRGGITSNLLASKSTNWSDLFSSEVQETRSQIIQKERIKILSKDNDHSSDVQTPIEDPNETFKYNPKTNEYENESRKIAPMGRGRGRGRGRPPIIDCAGAAKQNSKANECEIEKTRMSINDGDQDTSLESQVDEFNKPSSSDDDSNQSSAEDNSVIEGVSHGDISSKPNKEGRMEPDKISSNTDSNISSLQNSTDTPEDIQHPTNECFEPSTSNTEPSRKKTKIEEKVKALNKKAKNKRRNSQSKNTKKQIKEKPENESRRKPIESTSPKLSEETKYLLQFQNENPREDLPEDEVSDTNIICTVKRNQDYEDTDELTEEIDNFPVLKMMCPSHLYGSCKQNGVNVWMCDVCNSELRYGMNQYIYCVNCGRASAFSFTFKCSHVTHGEEFFKFPREDDVLAMLEKLGNREELNILILGETGVGKTTFINAFANYLTYDTLDEAERSELIGLIPSSFTLSDENYDEITVKFGETDVNESEEEGASKTQTCKCYSFPCGEKMVKLIDTPGIGDTKGIDQDAKNFVNILSFISNFSNIHGILLLMKPNNSRLNIFFRFCIQELLKHLHKSASENINFVFTNSKSTFYRPGDTFRPLKKLLSELRDVNIPLNQETIYCMDNDSFRFLVASHNNVKFTQEDLKEYTTSWKKSAKECERLLNRVAQLKPHSVKETLSINGARCLIVSLTQPLGDIIMMINENLYYINKHIQNLIAGQNKIEKIRKCLFVPVVDPEVEHFNKPRTVCGSERCTTTNPNGVENFAVCHNPCLLSGTSHNVVGNEQLFHCAIFKDGICEKCGCSWKHHMHMYYQMRKTYSKKMDSTANANLSNWETRQEAAEEIKRKLEEDRKCYTSELDYVLKASAMFTHFIAQNSLTQQSDFIMNYLRSLIDRERSKRQALGTDCESATFSQELEKAVNGYAREVSRLERERKDVTAQEIDVHVNMLYDLPKFGNIFKDIAQRHEQALAMEVARYSERVYVPRNAAGGGKRFQFS